MRGHAADPPGWRGLVLDTLDAVEDGLQVVQQHVGRLDLAVFRWACALRRRWASPDGILDELADFAEQSRAFLRSAIADVDAEFDWQARP